MHNGRQQYIQRSQTHYVESQRQVQYGQQSVQQQRVVYYQQPQQVVYQQPQYGQPQ